MSRLSNVQRYTIEVLLQNKKSKSKIAKLFSLNKSVIYREVRRINDERTGVYKNLT
ncbi:MAG: helix-turn-helix domain-containing protein [Crocinitomicaceae bacterium]